MFSHSPIPWLWISIKPGVRNSQVKCSLHFPVHLSIASIKPPFTITWNGPSLHSPWGKTTFCAQIKAAISAAIWGHSRVRRSGNQSELWYQMRIALWVERTLTRARAQIGENPGRIYNWGRSDSAVTLTGVFHDITMLSSAVRVGLSRVLVATKRCLLPTINAGTTFRLFFFVCRTLRFSWLKVSRGTCSDVKFYISIILLFYLWSYCFWSFLFALNSIISHINNDSKTTHKIC